MSEETCPYAGVRGHFYEWVVNDLDEWTDAVCRYCGHTNPDALVIVDGKVTVWV